MGFFKKLAMLVEEGNREAILVAAELSRASNPHTAILLFEKLGKDKEAQKIREELKIKNSYVEEDIFG